jgi:hypothetical protein
MMNDQTGGANGSTSYQLLATGYWLLAIGYWLLATGDRRPAAVSEVQE